MRCAFPALISATGLIGGAVLEDSRVLSMREPRRETADDGVEWREMYLWFDDCLRLS